MDEMSLALSILVGYPWV